MTRADGFLALVVLAVCLVLFMRATVFSRQQVRRMTWRTRLRIRPGAGFASHWEITFRFSRLAALYYGRRCRPDLRFTDRLICPARAYAVRLGRAQLGRKVYARGEDQVGIIAPQRTSKTGILADRVYGHPGACVAATTRADLYTLTSGKRAQRGPVEVFNPEGIGGIGSTFRVDIVADCLDPEVAIRTAAALTGPADGTGEMQFWLEKAIYAIAALMHAAALLGEDMSAVWRWSQLLGDPLKDALARPGASPELLTAAMEIQRDGKAADSIRMTMARSLAWVGVPALRRAVSGTGIRPFDAEEWAASNGTLYVINSGELSAAAPLFRAVVEKVHRDCVLAGSFTPYGRLPNPVLFALDEVTQTAAVPVADWLATSAGSGVQVCFIVHTPAQLRARYGKDQADAIWALAGTKIVLGGNTDADMAEDISTLAGMYGGEMALPVVPVAYIRQLPESRALVLTMNRSPITVKVRPVWRRLSFRLRLNPPAWMPLPEPVPLTPIRPEAEGEAA
jgi:type IV secretory pathway TraG/TraD family ATPase VirD4